MHSARSWTTALLLSLGGASALAACSDDGDDGGGGDSAGGADAGGSGGSGGATSATGGSGGARPDAGSGGVDADASTGGSGGASTGGSGGASTGGSGGASTGGSTADPCANFRCQNAYPQVTAPTLNPPTDEKAMLGKILFWDEQIGELGTVACGTCHRGVAGGSDPRAATDPRAHLAGADGILDTNPGTTSDDLRGGIGVPKCQEEADGGLTITDPAVQVTGRKPPTYLDAMFAPELFWDGRAGFCRTTADGPGGCFYDPDLPPGSPPLVAGSKDPTTNQIVGGAALEAQAAGPPTSSVEMACAGQTWGDIAATLRGVTPLAKAQAIPDDMKAFIAKYNNSYPQMFAGVYGTALRISDSDPQDVINTRRIVFAIATHERRLKSNQTPWDRWIAGDDAAMTPQQIRGWVAFMGDGKCGTCHVPPLFTDNLFHYIGFHERADDVGRQAITGAPSNADSGKMRTPTLRNAGLREAGGLLHKGHGSGVSLPVIVQLYAEGGRRGEAEIAPFIDVGVEVLSGLDATEKADMVEFLRNGLTDPRVKNETAPFDRPRFADEN